MSRSLALVAAALVGGLALATACSSNQTDSSNKDQRPSSARPSAQAQQTQPREQLIAITWCDTLHAGYRTQQKFALDGSRSGSPVYFNVTPVDATANATQAGCNNNLSGAELRSAFTADYDTIVTTKTDNGSRHAGFESSVSSVPETGEGGAPDPTPDNFYDLTGISADSLQEVLDTPGAVASDKKVYFTRETDGESGSDPTYQLMVADPDTPATPVRSIKEIGNVFFPPNATKPFVNTGHTSSGANAFYAKGGAYGFEGADGGLKFGSQPELEADKGTLYKVPDAGDILRLFHVYDRRHVLASTQEAIFDLTLSGSKVKAKKILTAPGHYLGDALLVGDTIIFIAGDDKGESSLYTVPTAGGSERRVYQFPAGTTAAVNILGTANSS
ncbi:hypothetical protein [Streptomyces sp. NPDC048243]|uniref:hypothetical protein n=1 Tax=Streptomyces sp. NPDC048243 TaxID=3365522 RepID=UPI0037110592